MRRGFIQEAGGERMRAGAPTYTNTRRRDRRDPTEGQRATAREGGGAEVTRKPSPASRALEGPPPRLPGQSWDVQEGRSGRGQLGPGAVGGLLLWAEANQGRCLDPLTCLGPSVPAGTPREQEGGLGPPEPAPANANTAAHATGRRTNPKLRRPSWLRAPRAPSGARGVLPPSGPGHSQVPWSPVPSAPSLCVG